MTRRAPERPDARLAAGAVGLVYALVYLYALGDLSTLPEAAWGARMGEPARWLDQRGLLQFEAIAMLEAGRVLWLISPLNTVVAAALGALLALNLDGAWALWRRPAACGLGGTGSGVLAAVPALLAGGACCAPSLLLLLAIPGLGAFAGLFGWLVPLSLVLLVASRWWQRHQGAPGWARAGLA
ncbi:MAG: hypothetical protein U5K43_10275 [Halofilum sp. (in: g-proteobacteria)]|nr:hypothetical protein [Halofilum sp. (in: g-proteobacteria)]